MDTIGLHMMRLAPKVKTAPYRTTANNIYAAVKGTGATTVDGERFEWSRGDVIAAPAWLPHFHEAAEDALLLRVTDEPVMQRLGFYRVEANAGDSLIGGIERPTQRIAVVGAGLGGLTRRRLPATRRIYRPGFRAGAGVFADRRRHHPVGQRHQGAAPPRPRGGARRRRHQIAAIYQPRLGQRRDDV